jgi:hypothetical protein
VTCVDEAIEVAIPAECSNVDANIEHGGDAPEGGEAGGVEVAAFEPRDHGPCDPGTVGHVLLPKAEALPDRPKDRPEALIVHPGIVTWKAYRARIRPDVPGRVTRCDPVRERSRECAASCVRSGLVTSRAPIWPDADAAGAARRPQSNACSVR